MLGLQAWTIILGYFKVVGAYLYWLLKTTLWVLIAMCISQNFSFSFLPSFLPFKNLELDLYLKKILIYKFNIFHWLWEQKLPQTPSFSVEVPPLAAIVAVFLLLRRFHFLGSSDSTQSLNFSNSWFLTPLAHYLSKRCMSDEMHERWDAWEMASPNLIHSKQRVLFFWMSSSCPFLHFLL